MTPPRRKSAPDTAPPGRKDLRTKRTEGGEAAGGPRVAVVIPCYRCADRIEEVVARVGPEVSQVVVVDDACPDGSGKRVEALIAARSNGARAADEPRRARVTVLYNEENRGVGGAVLRGMEYARAAGADILVKVDGDGQMAPELAGKFVAPIREGEADYAKGNRFYAYHLARDMPTVRLLGNGLLSFLTKLSSGYWNVFDPTNGYLAIAGEVFDELPHRRLDRRYFFETDLLCQLGLLRAVVTDIPMRATYRGETSGLSPVRVSAPFLFRHAARFLRRVLTSYFLRDFSAGSLYLLVGLPSLLFGLVFGAWQWTTLSAADLEATAGTVMLAALPVILGVVLLLNFLTFDVMMVPRTPLHPRLAPSRREAAPPPPER